MRDPKPAKAGDADPYSRRPPEMTDLSGLLERVEAASGPDRELDKALWYKLIFDPALDKKDDSYLQLVGSPYPAYTSYIDAALALKDRILPGHAVAVGDMAFEGGARLPWGCVWSPGGFIIGQAEAKTPALALLAALLRAVASERTRESSRRQVTGASSQADISSSSQAPADRGGQELG